MSESKPRAARFIPFSALLFGALWGWAIWSCAEHWRGNPNYSYGWIVPPLALGFGLRRFWEMRRSETSEDRSSVRDQPLLGLIALSVLFAVSVCALEFARQEIWHPEIVLWTICLLAVFGGLTVFALTSGFRFGRALFFPAAFFLTAVPWPPRFEQPLTGVLMRWVAEATAELLHWLGIQAQTSGAAIALQSGMVGITEACSGVRSLQAGIMFGLAMGEWFVLRPLRRVVLLAIAILLALLTNLGRTIALSLQAEWHGVASVAAVHDTIGNIMVTALVVGIWFAGKILGPRVPQRPLVTLAEIRERGREAITALTAKRIRIIRALTVAGFAGFICARVVYGRIEAREHAQSVPFFTAHANSAGHQSVPIPREIWNELRPTDGEYVHSEGAQLPRGMADSYHFFWKPSPWNRFALVHRPDICMPGIGWVSTGTPEQTDVDFNGVAVRFYAFRFRRGDNHALELWGVWRNGDPVSLDYQPAQVLGAVAAPPALKLEGKRRSATEIVACSIIGDSPPPAEIAVAILRSVFDYKRK